MLVVIRKVVLAIEIVKSWSFSIDFDISCKIKVDLENVLINLFESDDCSDGHTYLFYKSHPESICFKIESNAKLDQTGKGINSKRFKR